MLSILLARLKSASCARANYRALGSRATAERHSRRQRRVQICVSKRCDAHAFSPARSLASSRAAAEATAAVTGDEHPDYLRTRSPSSYALVGGGRPKTSSQVANAAAGRSLAISVCFYAIKFGLMNAAIRVAFIESDANLVAVCARAIADAKSAGQCDKNVE